jgi:hypothetical protein
MLEKRDWGRTVLFCGFLLCGTGAGASEVLLLALLGRVDLAQAAAVVAVEGALGPIHFEVPEMCLE